MNISDYLSRKGFQYKRHGENAIMNCPFCINGDRERKFAISLSSGAFNCLHLNSCGVKGSFYEFQKMLGDTPVSLNDKGLFANPPKRKTYKKPTIKISPPVDPVIKYLHRRGFTDETIKYFRIGAEDADTVMLPYYRNDELVNVKYRSISDKKKMRTEKEAEPILFNRDSIQDERLVICEGEYDAMALHQYAVEAVSVPMGAGNHQWIETEWEYLETFETICLCFDNDAAGQMNAREIAKKLGEWRCRLVTLPKKDANECLVSGIQVDEIIRCFINAEELKPDTLTTPMFFAEKVRNLFFQGGLFGVQTPWKKLNDILKGWREGEVTIWSGRNGSGKSTILNQVFLGLAEKEIKSCIYSGEMPPERYLRWAIIQHQGNEKPSATEIDNTLSWMDSRIYILNITSGVQPDKLLSDFEHAARRYNVKHFFVDSLMKISFKDQDEYRQQQAFMDQLTGFAQKFSVHVHLVAHPRKTEKDDDAPGKVDVKGTGHITDMAHNVIVLQRLSEEKKETIKKKQSTPADMRLYVKKNREFGIEGCVLMMFDERTKRFSDGRGL